MRVVISGATGAIGMALVRLHANAGDQVLVLARATSPRIRIPYRFPAVDVLTVDLQGYASAPANAEYDVFYHLAWSGGTARNDWGQNFSSVIASVDAVGLARRLGCQVFIGAGSQAECGVQSTPISDVNTCMPDSAFGAAKLAALYATRTRAVQLGLRFNWARILSVYGPYDGEKTLVTSTIMKLLNRSPLAFTDGAQVWDYLYSDDAARALRAIAMHGVDGKVYAVGSGYARPLREFIAAITGMFDVVADPFLGVLPRVPSQVSYLVADTSLLQQDCGWAPEVSFAEGIRRTIRYLADSVNQERL